ncbi:MAG: hypothetical protein IKV41_02390 [Oscillospiraceae bacterium]|nr:hypothetical protein [Oscillospiraceae bacterium]
MNIFNPAINFNCFETNKYFTHAQFYGKDIIPEGYFTMADIIKTSEGVFIDFVFTHYNTIFDEQGETAIESAVKNKCEIAPLSTFKGINIVVPDSENINSYYIATFFDDDGFIDNYLLQLDTMDNEYPVCLSSKQICLQLFCWEKINPTIEQSLYIKFCFMKALNGKDYSQVRIVDDIETIADKCTIPPIIDKTATLQETLNSVKTSLETIEKQINK